MVSIFVQKEVLPVTWANGKPVKQTETLQKIK